MQIVTSFRSDATSRPILTPTPTPIPGLVAGAAAITVGDWSPDGRFLTYWTHTPADLQANPQCNYHEYAVLSQRFPEPITRVVANSVDRSIFLLAGENSYWLYRSEGHEVRPVTGFAAGFENDAAFSPDGRFVALSGDAGDSYLLDTQTATATRIATWQGPQGLGGLAAPEWLHGEQFLIPASHDRGPLLISVAGSVQNVGEAFFGQTAGPGHSALASRDGQSGHFVVLLYDTSYEDSQPPLQLYNSAAAATQSLPIEGPLDQVDPSFSPGGRWYGNGRSHNPRHLHATSTAFAYAGANSDRVAHANAIAYTYRYP